MAALSSVRSAAQWRPRWCASSSSTTAAQVVPSPSASRLRNGNVVVRARRASRTGAAVAPVVRRSERIRFRAAAAAADPGAAATSEAAAEASGEEQYGKLKAFLKDAEAVGRVRVIVNTGMGVLESVTTLQGLFYHPMPGRGEYANVIKAEENVDFHLLLNKVVRVKLESGKSRMGNFNTHTMRFLDDKGDVGASLFVMWKPGTKGDYDEGQVEAFQELVAKYGDTVDFSEQ